METGAEYIASLTVPSTLSFYWGSLLAKPNWKPEDKEAHGMLHRVSLQGRRKSRQTEDTQYSSDQLFAVILQFIMFGESMNVDIQVIA